MVALEEFVSQGHRTANRETILRSPALGTTAPHAQGACRPSSVGSDPEHRHRSRGRIRPRGQPLPDTSDGSARHLRASIGRGPASRGSSGPGMAWGVYGRPGRSTPIEAPRPRLLMCHRSRASPRTPGLRPVPKRHDQVRNLSRRCRYAAARPSADRRCLSTLRGSPFRRQIAGRPLFLQNSWRRYPRRGPGNPGLMGSATGFHSLRSSETQRRLASSRHLRRQGPRGVRFQRRPARPPWRPGRSPGNGVKRQSRPVAEADTIVTHSLAWGSAMRRKTGRHPRRWRSCLAACTHLLDVGRSRIERLPIHARVRMPDASANSHGTGPRRDRSVPSAAGRRPDRGELVVVVIGSTPFVRLDACHATPSSDHHETGVPGQ